MPLSVEGLHHVTLICRDAVAHDRLFRALPGFGRAKITVNFDDPTLYHLYYGASAGRPGTIVTYFASPSAGSGRRGAGEAAAVVLRAPDPGALVRTACALGARPWTPDLPDLRRPGGAELAAGFRAPDGECYAVLPGADAGLAGVVLRLAEIESEEALLSRMGYRVADRTGAATCMTRQGGNGADAIWLWHDPHAPRATGGAGSVHHIAFAVPDLHALQRAQAAIGIEGITPTEVRDRSYFRSIYFRSPGGILFEFATNDPGFAVDEPAAALGTTLCLPQQHAHLRPSLEQTLAPLDPPSGAETPGR